MALETFVVAGTDKKSLKKALKFFLRTGKCDIRSFRYESMKNNADANVLVFLRVKEENSTEYPMEANAVVLQQHILQYMETISDKDMKNFEEPDFCCEEKKIAWELFTPDWYSEQYGIHGYTPHCILAVRPKYIEYGK